MSEKEEEACGWRKMNKGQREKRAAREEGRPNVTLGLKSNGKGVGKTGQLYARE